MPTFKLDGKDIPFEPGDSIIRAAARQGIEIPHYCYHPGLSVPANCRMCLVEVKPGPNQRAMMLDVLEWDERLGDYRPTKKPKLQPACQMAATEGQEVLGDASPHVRDARAGVQEFLLLNHPVDCPICDQSGECKLQDYWLEHQGTQKRMHDEPIRKPKAVEFGDTIVYDAERCVMCTRCIRFMDEVAKDPVLDMRERGNLNEVFVAPGRKLEGNYTFMTEHVCPVGALTTKDFRFKARVWFLRTAESICQGCATGCNAYLDYDPRYNKAYRYRPRDNEAVNQYWMCDEGMLSYAAAHEGRITEPRLGSKKASIKTAMADVAKHLANAKGGSLGVLLSACASQEDNAAVWSLGKALGAKAFYVSGRPRGKGDDVLMNEDKNSNAKGVAELCPEAKPFAALIEDIGKGQIAHVVALGAEAPRMDPEDATALGMLASLVVLASHEGPMVQAAHVTLPSASWAEAGGTFVNAKGLAQRAQRALNLPGSAQPAWQHVRVMAKDAACELPYANLKDLRGLFGPKPAGDPPSPDATASPS